MTENVARWYGVSTGNGNDGVSHMYADYYVFTDDPWTLAHAALIDSMKPGPWRDAAIDADVDGEADYSISAVIYHDPEFDPDDLPEEDREDWDNGNYEFGPAEFILEVFPEEVDEDFRFNRSSTTFYESIEDALSPEAIALAKGNES